MAMRDERALDRPHRIDEKPAERREQPVRCRGQEVDRVHATPDRRRDDARRRPRPATLRGADPGSRMKFRGRSYHEHRDIAEAPRAAEAAHSKLDQLKAMTKVVADTGDMDAIKKYQPVDCTTNPSLVLKAMELSTYEHIFEDAIGWGRANPASATRSSRRWPAVCRSRSAPSSRASCPAASRPRSMPTSPST